MYYAGSDIRIGRVESIPGADSLPQEEAELGVEQISALVEAYERVPGVELASQVLRVPGQDLTTLSGPSFVMIGVDVDSFSEVAWFRDDFSRAPVDVLLDSLKATNVPQGIELPADTVAIGVRLKADRLQPTVRISVRLRNAQDRHLNFTLGTLDSNEWTVLETLLEDGDSQALDQVGGVERESFYQNPPIALVSLQIDESVASRRLLAGSVLLDEIRVTDEAGETEIIEPFDDVAYWSVLRGTPDAIADEFMVSEAILDSESGSAIFFWGQGSPLTARGVFYGTERSPLPVLASKSFIDATGHSPGDVFEVSVGGLRLPVSLVDIVDLFPTITDLDQSFLVSDLTSLLRYANLGAVEREIFPSELWLSTTDDGPQGEALVQSLERVEGYESGFILNRDERLATSKVDPLVEAGWRALLFIAFSAVLVLSCVGFLVHVYVSFQSRQLQFALLRTVGLSLRQLITTVWLEQALVIAVGLALGTWMGGRLGATVMPFLGHDDWGAEVVPPFAIEVNWGTLLLVYAAMLLVFAIISLGLTWFIHRISLHRILRLGEA